MSKCVQSKLIYLAFCPTLCVVKALCGRVGGKIRSEYAMVGDVINLAARFMGKAKGRIVCDEVTHDLVRIIPYYYTERIRDRSIVPHCYTKRIHRTILPHHFTTLFYCTIARTPY